MFSSDSSNDEFTAAQAYYRQYKKLVSGSLEDKEARKSDSVDDDKFNYVNNPNDIGKTVLFSNLDPSSREVLSHMDSSSGKTSHVDSSSGKTLSHVDSSSGKAKMVNVGHKADTERIAMAVGRVYLPIEAFNLVAENQMKKGDVLSVAQLAGIMGAKRTSELIPLCHNIMLHKVDVDMKLNVEEVCVDISCTATTSGKTGVEMEALTGVAVAALTVYDMCKAVSHKISIGQIRLVKKYGGKSGDYVSDWKLFIFCWLLIFFVLYQIFDIIFCRTTFYGALKTFVE